MDQETLHFICELNCLKSILYSTIAGIYINKKIIVIFISVVHLPKIFSLHIYRGKGLLSFSF